MAERPPPSTKPVLQKPPGYRDPATTTAAPPRPLPRKQPLPPSFRPGSNNPKHHRRRRRSICGRLCCCLFLFLLILIFALTLAGALSYLWFQPKLPSFHLESLQTPQFRVAVKPDGSFLDATTVVRIRVSNPNSKIGFSYAQSEAQITVVGDDDGDVSLGSGSYPAFDQGRKNSTVMRFEARVKGVTVDDGVGSRLKARFRSKELRFFMEVRTRLGVRLGSKRSEMVTVRVLCGEVSLKHLEGDASLKCTINLLKWINLH